MSRSTLSTIVTGFTASFALLLATAASAQVTPAAGYTPPDDTPSIKVGATIYTNYTDQTSPSITDGDGNSVKKTSFDVARSYINITGNLSHIVAFRITPDVTRDTDTATTATNGTTGALNGSLIFRLKYAYLQTNFDDWMPKGSYAKFGIQQTPYLDYTEGIYRYRFQGTMFVERVGYFASADAGASFHYNLPSNYGDIHVGYFNGENYNKTEVNDQKSIMIRASLRPFATMAPVLRGLRVTGYYDTDHYIANDERKRSIAQATFENKNLNAAFEYISAKDQTTATAADVSSNGWSVWATPKAPQDNGSSFEALLRYDHWLPNSAGTIAGATATTPGVTLLSDQKQNRTIAGVAYWFPHQGSVTSALLLDYDGQSFDNITTAPIKAIAIHCLVNF